MVDGPPTISLSLSLSPCVFLHINITHGPHEWQVESTCSTRPSAWLWTAFLTRRLSRTMSTLNCGKQKKGEQSVGPPACPSEFLLVLQSFQSRWTRHWHPYMSFVWSILAPLNLGYLVPSTLKARALQRGPFPWHPRRIQRFKPLPPSLHGHLPAKAPANRQLDK